MSAPIVAKSTTATVATTAINYLQMRKLKLRVVSSVAQAYIASK